VGILAAQEVHAPSLRTSVLIARQVEGNVETLADTRQVLLGGLVAGAVLGLFLLLGRLLFRRG
jgi:hypothetical protein